MFKIEATSDNHFPLKPEMFAGADVLVVAGDLLMNGNIVEFYERIGSVVDLPHPVKIFVAGNHDRLLDPAFNEDFYRTVEDEFPSVVFLGYPFKRTYFEHRGVTFLGLPYVLNLPRWGFNRREEVLENIVAELGPADVVISHSPPKYVRDGKEVGESWGAKAWHSYIDKHDPPVWICGHIHESYGQEKYDVLNSRTTVYNVSMCNEHYEQVNKPIIIEVPVNVQAD